MDQQRNGQSFTLQSIDATFSSEGMRQRKQNFFLQKLLGQPLRIIAMPRPKTYRCFDRRIVPYRARLVRIQVTQRYAGKGRVLEGQLKKTAFCVRKTSTYIQVDRLVVAVIATDEQEYLNKQRDEADDERHVPHVAEFGLFRQRRMDEPVKGALLLEAVHDLAVVQMSVRFKAV